MSGRVVRLMRGRVAVGCALTSAAPGELGGFGYRGAQWPNGLLMGSGAHGDLETRESSAAYGPQAGLIFSLPDAVQRLLLHAQPAREEDQF
jgi:hypothetical protein